MERGDTLLIVHVFVCLFVFIYRPKENSKPRPQLCDTETVILPPDYHAKCFTTFPHLDRALEAP